MANIGRFVYSDGCDSKGKCPDSMKIIFNDPQEAFMCAMTILNQIEGVIGLEELGIDVELSLEGKHFKK